MSNSIHPIPIRFSPELLARIDASKPQSFNRSQWIKYLVEKQLDFEDKKKGGWNKGGNVTFGTPLPSIQPPPQAEEQWTDYIIDPSTNQDY